MWKTGKSSNRPGKDAGGPKKNRRHPWQRLDA